MTAERFFEGQAASQTVISAWNDVETPPMMPFALVLSAQSRLLSRIYYHRTLNQ
jgi:hypothetical protein